MTEHNSLVTRSGIGLPAIIFALWASVIVVLTQKGVFLDQSTSLPVRLMPAVIIPPGLFLAAFWLLPKVRAWVMELDLALVVGIQTFRVIGIIFLIDYAQGDLPAVFALPAGLGDIAVGIFALAVTVKAARDPSGQNGQVHALVVAGFLDFVAAFTFATLASTGMPLAPSDTSLPIAAQTLPTSLIPTLAVPAFMIAHFAALLKLSSIAQPVGPDSK
jgi:hypothetical protein